MLTGHLQCLIPIYNGKSGPIDAAPVAQQAQLATKQGCRICIVSIYCWACANAVSNNFSDLQDSTARSAELESTNKRVVQELADFKAESKELRNQDLTIKRLEAQLGQMKAQLQNKVSHSFTSPVCALQSSHRIATVWATLAFHFRLVLTA